MDLNRIHYFKLGHTAFIRDRSGIYDTVKFFGKRTPDDDRVRPKHVVKVKRRRRKKISCIVDGNDIVWKSLDQLRDYYFLKDYFAARILVLF
jgi:hypothetical protein